MPEIWKALARFNKTLGGERACIVKIVYAKLVCVQSVITVDLSEIEIKIIEAMWDVRDWFSVEASLHAEGTFVWDFSDQAYLLFVVWPFLPLRFREYHYFFFLISVVCFSVLLRYWVSGLWWIWFLFCCLSSLWLHSFLTLLLENCIAGYSSQSILSTYHIGRSMQFRPFLSFCIFGMLQGRP